jgi:hypothetical protein
VCVCIHFAPGARQGEVAPGVRQPQRSAGRRQLLLRGAVFHNVGSTLTTVENSIGPNLVTGGTRGERDWERAHRRYFHHSDRASRCRAPRGWRLLSMPGRSTGCPAPALVSQQLRMGGWGSSDQRRATRDGGWTAEARTRTRTPEERSHSPRRRRLHPQHRTRHAVAAAPRAAAGRLERFAPESEAAIGTFRSLDVQPSTRTAHAAGDVAQVLVEHVYRDIELGPQLFEVERHLAQAGDDLFAAGPARSH